VAPDVQGNQAALGRELTFHLMAPARQALRPPVDQQDRRTVRLAPFANVESDTVPAANGVNLLWATPLQLIDRHGWLLIPGRGPPAGLGTKREALALPVIYHRLTEAVRRRRGVVTVEWSRWRRVGS
jgi:hypothetical protein